MPTFIYCPVVLCCIDYIFGPYPLLLSLYLPYLLSKSLLYLHEYLSLRNRLHLFIGFFIRFLSSFFLCVFFLLRHYNLQLGLRCLHSCLSLPERLSSYHFLSPSSSFFLDLPSFSSSRLHIFNIWNRD